MSDTVREIVAVAVGVLGDYVPDPNTSMTRIERMALWIVRNLDIHVIESHVPNVSVVYTTADEEFSAVRVGTKLGLGLYGEYHRMTAESARQLAMALYLCVERAEES